LDTTANTITTFALPDLESDFGVLDNKATGPVTIKIETSDATPKVATIRFTDVTKLAA